MQSIRFVVPVEPFGKGRPRFSSVHGQSLAYTPTKTRKLENVFKLHARQAMNGRYPFERGTPLKVSILAFFRIPKSLTKAKYLACEQNIELPTKKPDIDNICKAALDAMNEAVFWDDKDVVSLFVEKRYTTNETGRIEVCVEVL